MEKVYVVIFNVTEKVNPENTTSSCGVYSDYDVARRKIADFVVQDDPIYEYWIDAYENVPVQ